MLDYLTVEYQGYTYKIQLNSVVNDRDNDGVVTNYSLGGNYTYEYRFTHILTDSEGNTSTFYFIDNDIYLQFTRINRADGTETTGYDIRIAGLYHDVTVTAKFKSHVVLVPIRLFCGVGLLGCGSFILFVHCFFLSEIG